MPQRGASIPDRAAGPGSAAQGDQAPNGAARKVCHHPRAAHGSNELAGTDIRTKTGARNGALLRTPVIASSRSCTSLR